MKNLKETLPDERLRLPVGDKTYTIDSPSILDHEWLKAMWDTAEQPDQPDTDEIELFTRALGKTYDEARADGLSLDEVRVMAMTATINLMFGQPVAEAYWDKGGSVPMRTEGEIREFLGSVAQHMDPHDVEQIKAKRKPSARVKAVQPAQG